MRPHWNYTCLTLLCAAHCDAYGLLSCIFKWPWIPFCKAMEHARQIVSILQRYV